MNAISGCFDHHEPSYPYPTQWTPGIGCQDLGTDNGASACRGLVAPATFPEYVSNAPGSTPSCADAWVGNCGSFTSGAACSDLASACNGAVQRCLDDAASRCSGAAHYVCMCQGGNPPDVSTIQTPGDDQFCNDYTTRCSDYCGDAGVNFSACD